MEAATPTSVARSADDTNDMEDTRESGNLRTNQEKWDLREELDKQQEKYDKLYASILVETVLIYIGKGLLGVASLIALTILYKILGLVGIHIQ